MTASRKLIVGGLIVATVTGYMAYLGASTSWQYYLTVDECAAQGPALLGQRVRVSGTVAANSLRLGPERKEATFRLKGTEGELRVVCAAPLPDNLAENIEVVVEGRLESASLLKAHKVITRCASKYQSQDQERSGAAVPAGPERGP